jgi:hypothetical protein
MGGRWFEFFIFIIIQKGWAREWSRRGKTQNQFRVHEVECGRLEVRAGRMVKQARTQARVKTGRTGKIE